MKRIWIYQTSRKLSETERAEAEKMLQVFTAEWSSHGRKLNAGFEIPYNHFIVIKVDESAFNASGCSIDASVRVIKEIEQKLNISLFDRHQMAYLQNEEVRLVSIGDIAEKYKEGTLSEDTLIFNNLVQNDSDYNNQWKIPFKESLYTRFV